MAIYIHGMEGERVDCRWVVIKQQEYCYIFAHNYYYQLLHQAMRDTLTTFIQ